MEPRLKKCCMSEPVWIFVYSGGTIYTVCDEHKKSPAYRVGLNQIIKVQTRELFTPEQIFGKEE